MGLVTDIGHIILEVGDMEQALRFYHDALGFSVKGEVDPVWTVITTEGGSLTLWRKKDPNPVRETPFNLHVANFEGAADALERAGYVVHRAGPNGGSVRDPWGNVLRLHDHRDETG